MLNTLTSRPAFSRPPRPSLRLAPLRSTPALHSVATRCPHRSRASPASLLQSGDVSPIPSALLCVMCLHPSPPSIYHPRPSGPRGRGTPGPAGHQRSSSQALNYLSIPGSGRSPGEDDLTLSLHFHFSILNQPNVFCREEKILNHFPNQSFTST